MLIPPEFRIAADAFPPVLRSLLEAELAAGNSIAEGGFYFPAPPAGALFKLNALISTRPRKSGDGLVFRDNVSPEYSGSFTDDRGFYFLLEPPLSSLVRFERSMAVDYLKWHDGEGYDLDALRSATPTERAAIESILLKRGAQDWRDAEALADLNTPRAREALKAAMEHPDPTVRLAVTRCAPDLIPQSAQIVSLVHALQTSDLYSGLSQALDQADEFHPKEIVDTLIRGALHRDGEAAVHFAALLMFLHGKADEPFDWNQRPFFLRFNTTDRQVRQAVFAELCEKIGVDSSDYL